MTLEGKIAIVTGSSQGIGQGIAERLAQEGANIAIDYHSNPDGANETLKRVEAKGRKGLVVKADLSVIADVNRLVDETQKAFGKIDLLVNNAGIEKNKDFWDVTESEFDAVMNVNMKGVFFITQSFARNRMAAKTSGKIINISSVHEELPFPHFTSYCMSKGAVKMMTRNLSIELAPYNITINSVAPGAIETPINSKLLNDPAKLNALLGQIPLKRLGKPQDVAGLVAFLASADADYVTGTTFFVDGGLLWNYSEQ